MKFVLTEQGIELQAKVEAGLQLVIHRMAASSEISENPQKLTVIEPECQELQIDSITADKDRAVITAALSNMGVTESYIVHQIGVYALDENGDELLFIVGQDATGDEIKAGTEEENVIEYNIALKVSNAEQVIFNRNLDDYVRKREFREHVEDYENPHRTTKAQVGLSEVPNVTTNNQTPTWRRASERLLPESGDTLSVILGRIERYLFDLKELAFTGKVSFENLSQTLQNQLLEYCPFVIMYQDIPIYERKRDKFYLMVTDKRGVSYNYLRSYVLMGEDIPLEEREEMVLYGRETQEQTVLELWDRLCIMRMLEFVVLSNRELAEGEIREQEVFYLYETEEKYICQE